MNKVKIQPSAHACPSEKGAAICMLEGLFSTWEAREREKKSQKPASKCSQKGRLSPVSASRGGPHGMALQRGLTEGSAGFQGLYH